MEAYQITSNHIHQIISNRFKQAKVENSQCRSIFELMTNQIDLAYGPGVWNLKHPSKRECSAQILSYIDWNANFCSIQGRSIGHGSHSPWRRNCPLGTTGVIENLNCEHMTTQSLPQHHHNITERPNCIPHIHCNFSAFYSRSFTWHHMHCHIFPISGHKNPFHLGIANLFFHHFAKFCLDRSHGLSEVASICKTYATVHLWNLPKKRWYST